MNKNPKHPAGNVARKVGSGFLERLLSFLDTASLQVIAGIKHLGGLKRFIAKEDELDGRMKLRLGAWGIGSIVALVIAIIAVQTPASARRDQPSAEVSQQAQQLQRIAKDNQNQTRQLSAAMDTLNKDRDRLYNRVTVLEQALDAVNGSIAKLSAPPPVVVAAAPSEAPASPSSSTASQPAPQQVASASIAPSPAEVPMASVQPASDVKSSDQKSADAKQRAAEVKKDKEMQPAAAPVAPPKVASVATSAPAVPPAKAEQKAAAEAKPEAKAEAKAADKPADRVAAADPAPAVTGSIASADMPDTGNEVEKPVEQTKFGVDLGAANSVEGLRALWRGLRGPHRELFAQMQPLIVVKERTTGYGMQLHLVAGPLTDAAAAAKLCATLTEKSKRACEPSAYDGQRLAMGPYQGRDTAKIDAAGKADAAAKTEAANGEAAKPEPAKKREASNYRRRSHVRTVAPPPLPSAAAPPAPPPQRWSLSSIFGRQQ